MVVTRLRPSSWYAPNQQIHLSVEVVLQKAAEVCESILRQHHNEETIPGRGVLKHANVLEELACNFREVWDDDKVFRSGYKPFVRTALLECMREKEEEEEEEEEEEVLIL